MVYILFFLRSSWTLHISEKYIILFWFSRNYRKSKVMFWKIVNFSHYSVLRKQNIIIQEYFFMFSGIFWSVPSNAIIKIPIFVVLFKILSINCFYWLYSFYHILLQYAEKSMDASFTEEPSKLLFSDISMPNNFSFQFAYLGCIKSPLSTRLDGKGMDEMRSISD